MRNAAIDLGTSQTLQPRRLNDPTVSNTNISLTSHQSEGDDEVLAYRTMTSQNPKTLSQTPVSKAFYVEE